jgi:type I restriction enzyme S subunit
LYRKLYELRYEFNAIARGAGQQNISGIVVKNKEVVVPAKLVIDNFTDMLKPIFENIKNISFQIRHLTEARDRLLPKLMSGEIEV